MTITPPYRRVGYRVVSANEVVVAELFPDTDDGVVRPKSGRDCTDQLDRIVSALNKAEMPDDDDDFNAALEGFPYKHMY